MCGKTFTGNPFPAIVNTLDVFRPQCPRAAMIIDREAIRSAPQERRATR